MKKFITFATLVIVATVMTIGVPSSLSAACNFKNKTKLTSLSAGFDAWKVVTEAMATCGNYTADLDQDFKDKQPSAMAANPSLYTIGGVANGTLVPLVNDNLIRPLDDLVARYGQDLLPSQLIKRDGKIVAIAMMVNAQHLMYRKDILAQLDIPVPNTYAEVLAAAEKIKRAGVVEYPLGGTFKSGWNLGEEFINMYLGFEGEFFSNRRPAINNAKGRQALEMLKALTEYMDPEYLVSDSTYVQKQFQQGKIAMANLWASRAGAMNDAAESQVVGKIGFAAAPKATRNGPPATTLWWDGMVIAKNASEKQARAAFRVMMYGISDDVLAANKDSAIWLSDAFEPSEISVGALASASAKASDYPASTELGLMHTALGNNISDYLTGSESAEQTLKDIENEYNQSAREKGLF